MSRRSNKGGSEPPPVSGKGSPTAGDYDVGYGKPPVASRFQPGTSGNPKGRPRLSDDPEQRLLNRPAQKILQEELYRTIKMRDGNKEIEVPALQAITRAAIITAVKGSSHAQKTLLQFGYQLEEETIRRKQETFKSGMEAKWTAEATLRHCRLLGLPEDFAPIHPDDILIDVATGDVQIVGPMTAEQKAVVNDAVARRDEAQAMMLQAVDMLKVEPDDAILQAIRWIAQGRFDTINDALPPRFQKDLEGRLPPGAAPPKFTGAKPRRLAKRVKPLSEPPER